MKKYLFLIPLFCIGLALSSYGQENDTLKLYPKKHYVFFNTLQVFDPNGSSLQFGINLQCAPWMDFQLEGGFLSDNLVNSRLPFNEYVGYRVRPQLRFYNKKFANRIAKPSFGLLLSYQDLTFRENNNFEVDEDFIQNITYDGTDKTIAWYLMGAIDAKSSKWFVASLSFGIGQVWIKTKAEEGVIPENAELLDDCFLFCGRSNSLDQFVNRVGVVIEVKVGYMF